MKAPQNNLIFGIDFSGARDAGKKIWLAEGIIEEKHCQLIHCFPASSLPDSGKERQKAIPALVKYIKARRPVCVGLDFPFSLPVEIIPEISWRKFLLNFPQRYNSPDEFRIQCLRASGGGERKRITELLAKTPFSSYNLRIYRQTYYGIREVLLPLVKSNHARALPMQKPKSELTQLLEICPASTLKSLESYSPYKGQDEIHFENRKKILNRLTRTFPVQIPDKSTREQILQQKEGDALDAVIALATVWKQVKYPAGHLSLSEYKIEGYVYH